MEEFTEELSAAKGQRTDAWKEQRLGKITASKCKIWMQRGRKKNSGWPTYSDEFGQTCLTYLYGVLAEILTGSSHEIFGAAIDWGEDLEEQAIIRYIEKTGNKARRIGYVEYQANNLFGGSPDGLIEPDGMLEVKCPFNPANHVQTLITKDIYNEDHRMQIQANLLFTDRKWCDYVTYDPRVFDKDKNINVIRIERDEEIIENIILRTVLITNLFDEFKEKIK